MYRLHRTDETAYLHFKAGLQNMCLPAIEVLEDRMKGFYLSATAFIPKNTIIAEYSGELITARESLNAIHNDSIFQLIRNPRSKLSLDIAPTRFSSAAIFISGINNSSKEAINIENVRAIKFVYWGIARLIFVTSRDIDQYETLYLNYNGDKAISEYPTSSFVH
jgi:hypothetical protein